MELRCQLERHTAALYADRAPVITNRRADAVLSFYLARARKPLFHHPHPPPPLRKIREILGRNIGNTTKMYAGKFSQNLRRSAFHTSSIRKDDVETEEFKYFTINFCLCLLFSSYRFSIFVKYSFLFFFYLQINTRFIIFLEMEINRETNGEIGITITGAARSIR